VTEAVLDIDAGTRVVHAMGAGAGLNCCARLHFDVAA
jgi:hypothetical protein